MAADIKAKNWNAVENRIADGFQSVHPDGPRDRAGEIALLKKMNFGDFTLSNFKSTVVGDQHRSHIYHDRRTNHRRQAIASQTGLPFKRVEERCGRLAVD